MTKELEKTLDYIQLINCENLGPVSFYKLLEHFGSAKIALENLPPKFKLFPRSLAKLELDKAKSKGIEIITFDSPLYPQKLSNINDAPPILYTLGNKTLLNHPVSISVVGARNASINGRKTASRIAYDLTNADVLIISGMARGIDSSAHKGSMYAKSQSGPTIAVLGTGVDIVYPKENDSLYNEIKEKGLIISEFPIGTQPQSNNFPRRNRIVSALSNGTLIVEATLRSGSLITARLALEQNRDVFAVPGSPNDARSLGPNSLIKEGAHLVESAQDIIDILKDDPSIDITKQIKLSIDNKPKSVAMKKEFNNSEINLLDYLDPAGTHIDELIRASNLDSAEVSLALIELELIGKIERQPGNIISLVK